MSDVAGWAIKLIRDHVAFIECDIPEIAAQWQRSVTKTLTEVEEADRLGTLFAAVLRLYAEAAKREYSQDGLMRVWGALLEIPEAPADNLHHYKAAEVILAHSQISDSGFENELRDIGADSFERIADYMDDLDSVGPTLLAVIELWVRLLPTLHTAGGFAVLERIASEVT